MLTCLYLGSPELNESDEDDDEPLELTVLSLSVSSVSLSPTELEADDNTNSGRRNCVDEVVVIWAASVTWVCFV